MRGLYIVFEGMNGAGKSTLIQHLVIALRKQGTVVATLESPGYVSPVGKVLCRAFEDPCLVTTDAMFWLFLAEAVDLEPRIQEMLDAGVHVVCHRHTQFSARVYQSKVHNDIVVQLALGLANLRSPDRLYIIDVPPEVAIVRRQAENARRRRDPYEDNRLEIVSQERESYRSAIHAHASTLCPVRTLDGTASIGDNVQLILSDIKAGHPVP
jgi:dTMP kinase